MEKYGCQEIVKEAFTGKTMERPKFLKLLEVLQEGDTLVVCNDAMSHHLDVEPHTPEKITFKYTKYSVGDTSKQSVQRPDL